MALPIFIGEKMAKHILSCSFGKDSIATALLALQHGEPLDELVYCEVMFSEEISGELPEHNRFIHETAIPYFEQRGIPTRVLRSEKTYLSCFYHVVTRGKTKGMLSGFPLSGRCTIQRDCKLPPIKAYQKALPPDTVQYIGIAADEPKRLARLKPGQISLMDKYHVAEPEARSMCAAEELLSPLYDFTKRGGCWFCPNASISELRHLYRYHPELWQLTAPIVTHAPKLPTISSKQATVEAISRGVHYIAAKIKALLSQTVRHAAQSLLALLGAGGVVLLLAMVIGAAAAVIGSPMGILFADESGDPNSIPIAEIVADTNADFGAAINDIVSAHPECSETTITYDYEDGHTWASYWPEVLAIFAVHTNLNSDSDVVVINAAQMQRIQDTFWAMHEITYEVEEVDTTPEPTEDDPDPEQQTDYILHITVSSKTVDELAELYNFTQDQKDILHQLLSEEMRPSLLALCGGIAVADGELCWPLPGHTYISCHFGEVDAFGNAGHRGTDIPAPESTPILAAHSGTVLVSGWNDSYGNQVLLDNGAGLSTRYAHMTQTAVTAGEAVTAGQVIGYVGSTGDSTGNHLHFEVMQNGVRMNPLELVFAQ